MFPSGYSNRYSGRQFIQDKTSSSSASSSRSQQTPLGGAPGYSTRGDYLRDATENESELGHLLSPPSPPPSLDLMLSVGPSNSSSQRPPSPNPYSSYRGSYENVGGVSAEPSSSSPQIDAGVMATSSSHDGHQTLFYDFAQSSYVQSPSFSRGSRQSAANESTSRVSRAYSRYPGVQYENATRRFRVRWQDPSLGGARVSLGSFSTQSEAIKVLEDYKASRGEALSRLTSTTGVSFTKYGKWQARYTSRGKNVHIGTYRTKEEAERALHEHLEARRLPPLSGRRRG